jgi:ArsR family transcriptional regulator, arsenate/arsenite/antimonite-responsive transcriptional repressor
MGITKTGNFTEKQVRIAQLAKAIGHPARIAIIQYLIGQQSCFCGDIVDELPLAQATVSQHLKELKDAGIIKGDISGAKTCYCINEKVWEEVRLSFGSFLASYQPAGNCC